MSHLEREPSREDIPSRSIRKKASAYHDNARGRMAGGISLSLLLLSRILILFTHLFLSPGSNKDLVHPSFDCLCPPFFHIPSFLFPPSLSLTLSSQRFSPFPTPQLFSTSLRCIYLSPPCCGAVTCVPLAAVQRLACVPQLRGSVKNFS